MKITKFLPKVGDKSLQFFSKFCYYLLIILHCFIEKEGLNIRESNQNKFDKYNLNKHIHIQGGGIFKIY